ncbi:MAG TPA: PAS and helix-turn-helix domain-containing protein [Smithella sp.]|nr:PAS and helix-turn-helix domain-containing protein [Smithella sp.]
MMKSQKRTGKILRKDLVYASFMKSPIPMCINTMKEGIYVEVNDAALKYTGLKRKDMIGQRASDLGYFPAEQRRILVDELKKHGYARNILLELNLKNQESIRILYGAYPVEMGKKKYLHCFAHNISNHKPAITRFQGDKFYEITFINDKYVKVLLQPFKLTPRKEEVAVLLAKGLSNRDIAQRLFISENTVKEHMKDIFRAIGVGNRGEFFPKLLNLR